MHTWIDINSPKEMKQFSEYCLKPRRFLGLKFNRRSINKPNGTLYIDALEKMDPGMEDSVDESK